MEIVDSTYFTGGFGKIKYEHHEFKGPAAFVGFPTKLFKKGKKTFFEGELIPFDPDVPDEKLSMQQRNAKGLVSLLQHMEDFNKRHPNAKQKAGWSIEGDYLAKSKQTGKVKARLVDVVFTTKPVNLFTFAELIKSLEVGYAHGVTDQGGFGATRESSLEGDNKNLTNNNNSRGITKMKSKEEVYKSCRSKGMDHEAALKEADEWEKKHAGEMAEHEGMAKKSIADTKTALEKSVASANAVEDMDIDFNIDGHKKALAKSVEVDPKSNEVDVTAFMTESQNVSLKVLEALEVMDKEVKELAKSISTLASANIAILDSENYSNEMATEAVNKVNSLEKGLATLTRVIANKPVAGTNDYLSGLKVEDNNNGGEGKQLTKSQQLQAVDALIEEGKIPDKVATEFEIIGAVPKKYEAIVKAKANELFK